MLLWYQMIQPFAFIIAINTIRLLKCFEGLSLKTSTMLAFRFWLTLLFDLLSKQYLLGTECFQKIFSERSSRVDNLTSKSGIKSEQIVIQVWQSFIIKLNVTLGNLHQHLIMILLSFPQFLLVLFTIFLTL